MDVELRHWAAGIGAAHVALGAVAAAAPAIARQGLGRFSRHVRVGGFLSAAALLWCALIVRGAALGSFEFVKPWLFVAAPTVWIGTLVFMSELLAPRALGGLLLLAAAPLLESARLHPAAAARILSVLGYVWVIAGMTWVAAPWRFRDLAGFLTRSPPAWWAMVAGLLTTGAGLLVLAFTVYA